MSKSREDSIIEDLEDLLDSEEDMISEDLDMEDIMILEEDIEDSLDLELIILSEEIEATICFIFAFARKLRLSIILLPFCEHLIDAKNDSGETSRQIAPHIWESVVKDFEANWCNPAVELVSQHLIYDVAGMVVAYGKFALCANMKDNAIKASIAKAAEAKRFADEEA